MGGRRKRLIVLVWFCCFDKVFYRRRFRGDLVLGYGF